MHQFYDMITLKTRRTQQKLVHLSLIHLCLIIHIFFFLENEPVVSFIIPVNGETNQFAVGLMRRIAIIEWDGKSSSAKMLRVALEVEKDDKLVHNRFNDGKADPTGRIYSGTMRREQRGDIFDETDGTLYKYAKGEEVTSILARIGVSNGLAWNAKKDKFYYIDSCAMNIREFDWNAKTGDIGKSRFFRSVRIYTDRWCF